MRLTKSIRFYPFPNWSLYIRGMNLKSLSLCICLITSLYGQTQDNFLGHWTGDENLDSPTFSYENRNISIVVSEGGDREGFYIYSSSCDFVKNPFDLYFCEFFNFGKTIVTSWILSWHRDNYIRVFWCVPHVCMVCVCLMCVHTWGCYSSFNTASQLSNAVSRLF